MKLNSILTDKKAPILKKWLDVAVGSCPSGASPCFKAPGDAFTNPTGATISKGLENIFNELLRGPDKERISKFLGDIVRVRAVQGMPPSEALSFFFSLKRIIREELRRETAEEPLSQELLSLESSIDGIALSAFDMFMACREKMYAIKANEIKRANFRFLQRADLLHAACTQETASEGNNYLNIKEER
jgi:hypothetical protein